MKDLNDILVAGGSIASLKVQPIDLYVAEQILAQFPDDQHSQYKAIEKYSKTIKHPLIKADLARLLKERWKDKEIDEIKTFLKVSEIATVDDILQEFKDANQCISEMEYMVLNHEGITTGYPGFDASIGGLSLTDVFFISARPSVGKTFIAMEMALHMAIRLKLNVLFFSLEMAAGKFYKRIVANIYKISIEELEERIKNKTIDYELLLSKIKEYLLINDKTSLTIDDIEQRIVAVNNGSKFKHNKGKVQIVFIDYVQMMPKMSNFEYFEEKVMYFKPVARNQNVLLVPLSQMARTTKSWEEPDVSNMKGGGALEQVGDTIWLLWKESENPKLSSIDRQIMEEKGEDNIINSKIGKARNGFKSRYFQLISDKKTTSVKELYKK